MPLLRSNSPRVRAHACFFFNDTATTEIYTLSLHDALPICRHLRGPSGHAHVARRHWYLVRADRSEEHTSELQSHLKLVCRLLLEKKNVRREVHRRMEPVRLAPVARRRLDDRVVDRPNLHTAHPSITMRHRRGGLLFFLMTRPPPRSTLFPYTTLFR